MRQRRPRIALSGLEVVLLFLMLTTWAHAEPTMELLNHTRTFSAFASSEILDDLICMDCPPYVDSRMHSENGFDPFNQTIAASASSSGGVGGLGGYGAATTRQSGTFAATHIAAMGFASASTNNGEPGSGCCTSSSNSNLTYSLSFALDEPALALFTGFVDTNWGYDSAVGASVVIWSEGREISHHRTMPSGIYEDPSPLSFDESVFLVPGFYLVEAGAGALPTFGNNTGQSSFALDLTIHPVPEPATAICGFVALLLAIAKRMRRAQSRWSILPVPK